jgi:CRISPR-associated protein Cas2
MVKSGRAIMLYGADNEQGLAFEVHAHDWIPVDFDGINQPDAPPAPRAHGEPSSSDRKAGWSNASKRRRYGNR